MVSLSTRGVLLLVLVLTFLCLAQAGRGGGNGGGGRGRDRNGWRWPWGRGHNNRPPHGGSNCRRWTIPDLCEIGEEPEIDRDGCISCIDLSPEIDGCTTDELEECADEWEDLPYCGAGEWPQRSNDTCCYQCRPMSTDKCSRAQVRACAAAWIGKDNSTALPYCDTTSANATGPVYNAATCCVDCKVPLEWNMTAGDEGCTLAKFKTCTAAMPVCANGEAVIFDTEACCGSCRRPTRTCDIASVVRCYTSAPKCGANELPQWLSGDCCPSCIMEPLTANSTGCESCTDNQICIRESDTDAAGNVTFTNTCKTRADITFSLTVSGKMAKVFSLLSANHVRHIIAEYIRRFCDKADNMVQCAAFRDAMRDLVISTTIECTGGRRTNGGDRRCDGRWGAAGDAYEWRNGTIVANPATCTVTAMISVALQDNEDTGGGDGGNSTETASADFRAQALFKLLSTGSTSGTTPSAMIKAALSSDGETLDDGMYGEVTKDTTSGVSSQLVVSPFIIMVTMIIAMIA